MKLQHFFYCLSTVALLASSAGVAQAQTQVHTHADKQQIVLGDPVKVSLSVEQLQPGSTITWPQLKESYDGLELIDTARIDTLSQDEHTVYRFVFQISAYDSGSFLLPPLEIGVHDAQQGARSLYSDSIRIQVQTVVVDTTQAFKPIKDIVPVKSSWLDYWPYLLAGLLLLVILAFVAYYFYKNKKVKIPEAEPITPPEKAHEKALRLLTDLQEKKYWQQGKVKLYYSELSDIIRNYLDDRFGLNSMEQTTDELMALLKKQTEERAGLRKVRPDLKKLLQTADLVKFAKANPDSAEHDACLNAARKVVHTTQIKQEEGRS